MATINIEGLTAWTAGKRVETKQGPRNLRTGPCTQAFRDAWKAGKDAMKAAGLGWQRGRDGEMDWDTIVWWAPISGEEAARSQEAQAASRATDADIDPPCPDGLAYLGYQKAGIAYALRCDNTLLADQMGLGKTITSIGVFNADPSIMRVLVVCPASLRLNWRREFEKWATRPIEAFVVNGGKPSDWMVPATANGRAVVAVVNYDVLAKHRKAIDATGWDMLVCDECHFCKNPKAVRTKAVLGSVTRGKRTAEGIKARRKLFLTGTPIVNRPVELWPLVEALDPQGLGKSFFSYAKRYADAHETKWGWDFTGASNLEELQRRLREGFMVRRLKDDVLAELPPKRRQVVEIPANGASAAVAEERAIYEGHREYLEALAERIAEAEEEARAGHRDMVDLYGAGLVESWRREYAERSRVAFAEMSKTRHAVALAKVPHVVEHLRDALDEGPVVCFAHHRDVIAAIEAEFPEAVALTGETSMEDRQAAVDAFQAGAAKLFIGNIQAAGVGITLTASSHVVFAELDWVPGNMSQAEDRLHRIGQRASVLVQHLVLEGSMDADMARKLIDKQEVIDKALDRKAGQAPAVQHATEVAVNGEALAKAQANGAVPSLPPEQADAVRRGLRMLAGTCDGARSLDGCGFNKLDAEVGRRLAGLGRMTDRQAAFGRRLCVKYRRQLPADINGALA